MRSKSCIIAMSALLLTLAGSMSHSASLQQRLRDNHLSIATSVQPAEALVPGQKARLSIEIATDTWFSGGTRISVPEVPGLVIVQNEQFATNATDVRGGETWVVQRWTLDIFPQAEGSYQIPAVRVSLKVNAGSEGVLEGDLLAPPTQFEVVRPAALADVERWVAAPSFSVEQHFSRDLDALQVGDAFEQEIAFNATDVMAMMLPEAQSTSLPGLAAYPSPPLLEDRNNRGQAAAQRVQSTSYIAEQPGEFLLPGQAFYWWNTTDGTLEVLEIPAQKIVIAGEPVRREKPWWEHVSGAIGAAVGGLLLLAAVAAAGRHLPFGQAVQLLRQLYEKLRELRRPGLPDRLNP